MKKNLLLAMFLLCSGWIFAQQYPLVTIQDIQFVADSTIDPPSPLTGDTVRVQGTVMVSPLVNPSTDRRPIIAAGARWVTYIEDKYGNVYGGLNILQQDIYQVVAFFNIKITFICRIQISDYPKGSFSLANCRINKLRI